MRIDEASSGAECLHKVKKRRYDVILMDYMMPGMDGAETMRRLKQLAGFDTPVIALTANVVSGTREKLMGAGFTRHLSKPVRLRNLEEAVLEVLPKERVTAGAANGAQQAATRAQDALAGELRAFGIALEDALSYVEGDLAQYGKSAAIFTETYAPAVAAARGFAAMGDWENLQYKVHSLKGNARNLGANALCETAAKVERLCEAGDGAHITVALPLLFFEWERARDGLRAFAEALRASPPEQAEDVQTAPELGELLMMLRSNRYQNAMDALAALLKTCADAEQIRALREVRQKTDELCFREAERLLAGMIESR
jgi:CheY-like chemotaxis protein